MNVVFIQSVPGVAKVGERKQVKDGYAINFLLPKGLALPANDLRAAKLVQQVEAKVTGQRQKVQAEQEELKKLDGKLITIEEKAAKTGKLYEGVGRARIAALLNIPEEAVDLKTPLKAAGEASVSLLYHGAPISSVRVDVQAVF